MKGIRIKVIFAMILLLPMASSVCYGLDTDLYVLSGTNIPPNVLIILDSSASMDEVTSGQNYDPTIDYSAYTPPTVYPRYAAYILNKKTWDKWVDDYRTIACEDLRDNYLAPFGMATNYSNAPCGISKKDFQTGNFLNYVQLTGGPGGSRPRFGLANGIIHSYINTTSGVRFAVMAFNRDKDGNTVKNNSGAEFVSNDGKDDPWVTPWDAVGGRLLGFVDENKNGKTDLFNALATLKNDSWSPLAETLYETGVYLQGKKSAITGTSYTSPVQYYCQKNYILIISDGVPTKDSDSGLNSIISDMNKNGMVDLDEVAKYLYGLDLNGELNGEQNIKPIPLDLA
jgi:type IV pilus assembly protein PilY1